VRDRECAGSAGCRFVGTGDAFVRGASHNNGMALTWPGKAASMTTAPKCLVDSTRQPGKRAITPGQMVHLARYAVGVKERGDVTQVLRQIWRSAGRDDAPAQHVLSCTCGLAQRGAITPLLQLYLNKL